ESVGSWERGLLGTLRERPSAGVRYSHAGNLHRPTTRNYAIGLRGCESGADQVDQHLDREPVRISTGLTLLSLRSPGLKTGPHRLDDGLDRLRREWKPPKHRAAVGSGAAKNPRGAVRLAALLASCVANLSKATGKLRMPALPANVRYRQ